MSLDRTDLALCVDVLGPLALRVHGSDVEVPGSQRRALLAILALEGGRVVGAERLVESLWPEGPPENAAQSLYNHVSRLRGHLGPLADRLQRHGGGYRLVVEDDEVDADAARRLAGGSDLAAAATALKLWRGSALEEFRGWPALEVAAVSLDELRLRLRDDLLAGRLALADPSVAADAATAVREAPLRERSVQLLVQALAAEGRTAEAMEAAQAYRLRLADETGLDPPPAFAGLEQQVARGELARTGSMDATRPGFVARPDGPLVGRQHDREEVRRLLGENTTVTVTGPGGVGKTRLALEVAADISEGQSGVEPADVVVVDLAAVDRADRVCQAVASTLGLRTSGRARAADVAAGLSARRVLLLLDNCEHLSEACRELVSTVRRSAPGVRVLATSRTVLHVPGEHVVRLQPLPVPRDAADLESLGRQPGVRAFLAHARRHRGEFELTAGDAADLVDVLRRLDGLPLGIELAARQVALMPLADVRRRLDRALDLAIGAGTSEADRQRTLRATIDSSYRLLRESEQRLLRAMAPFPGGVDLATVEALSATAAVGEEPLDVLHRLVDASLVVADATTARYRLLFTVRDFLLEALQGQGEQGLAEERFLDRCLVTAAEIGRAVIGPAEPEADRRLRLELDNWRAARDLALARGRDDVRVGITLQLSDAATQRDLRELWSWALELAADPGLAQHPNRSDLLACAADAARLLGDLDLAVELADEAIAAPSTPAAAHLHHAWMALGSVAHFRGDFAAARDAWLTSGEYRGAHGGVSIASAALAAAYGGDRADARRLLDRARESIALTGCVSHAAFAAYVDGEIRATDNLEQAISCYLQAVSEARRCGAVFVEGVASVALASARARAGEIADAAEGFGRLLDSWRRTGHRTQLWTTARNAAALLAGAGRWRAAGLLLISADDEPGAAAVSPEIARHSGRVFMPLSDVVPAEHLDDLRQEAALMGPEGVLDLAREELILLSPG